MRVDLFHLMIATGFCVISAAGENRPIRGFDSERDLISLHYDHAPDRDDGHSAAADRCVLETLFGIPWIKAHVVALSGAYGTNAKTFQEDSDAVMDAVWNDSIGWLDAHERKKQSTEQLVTRWIAALDAGGHVWVKEGGQSDITAEAVKAIQTKRPSIDPKRCIHVVQHSDWNEKHTTKEALKFVKKQTDYIRIRDANRYLNQRGGDPVFARAAADHPAYGRGWKAAWSYYDPKKIIDFSDTGELLHILGLGEMSMNPFRERFLADRVK